MRMRRRNEGRVAESATEPLLKDDPVFSKLDPHSFSGNPPVLRISTEQTRPGIFVTHLLWDSASHFGHGSSEVKVGKFVYHSDSPEEVATELTREFKAQGETFKIGYLKHMEVVPEFRGQSGAVRLFAAAAEVLGSDGGFGEHDMLVLSYLDTSSKRGRLVRFYEFLGFVLCSDIDWGNENILSILSHDTALMVSDFGSFRRKISRMNKAATAKDPLPRPN